MVMIVWVKTNLPLLYIIIGCNDIIIMVHLMHFQVANVELFSVLHLYMCISKGRGGGYLISVSMIFASRSVQ